MDIKEPKDLEFRKLCTEVLSTKEGTKIFLDMCKKHYPPRISDGIEKLLTHNQDFINKLNDTVLDKFSKGNINKKELEDVLSALQDFLFASKNVKIK